MTLIPEALRSRTALQRTSGSDSWQALRTLVFVAAVQWVTCLQRLHTDRHMRLL